MHLDLTLLIVGIVAVVIPTFIYEFCMLGAFPFIVEKIYRKEKIGLKDALVHGWKNKGRVFWTSLLLILIVIPLLILSVAIRFFLFLFVWTFFESLFLLIAVVAIAAIAIYFFIFMRLALVYSVLILEGLKPLESLKRSWSLMKGKILSFFVAVLLLEIIVGIPTWLVSFIFRSVVKGVAADIFESLLATIPTTFSLVLPTVYYLLLRKEEEF